MKKVLIVEDETAILEPLKARLEAEGYEVITASDGEDGLKKARALHPDLMILDVMLPKMDGYKVCGLLKNDARYSRVPIIMFTARTDDDSKRLAAEMCADVYMSKPFRPEILLGKVKELLERS
jgi:DNA-binding response OmpR family regulator